MRQDSERTWAVARQVRHPSPASTHINAVFGPTSDEVAWATRVVASFDVAGSGVLTVDGVMIDRPTVEQARNILGERTTSGSRRDASGLKISRSAPPVPGLLGRGVRGAASRIGAIRRAMPQADACHGPIAFRILTFPT